MKLIKNGTVLTAESEFKGDILIDGETIMGRWEEPGSIGR